MLHALFFALTFAAMPPVGRAPVSATGLTSGRTFEGWVQFPGVGNPHVKGMAMHTGDRIRVTFPRSFTPASGAPMAYLLYGWAQGDADANYTVKRDRSDARTIVIEVHSTIAALTPQMPGVKAVHLIAPLRNPAAGTYHLHVAVTIAGRTHVADEPVHIDPMPVVQLAPFNAMHGGRNEDWQTVRIGGRLPTDVDFLYTDAGGEHPANLTLETVGERPTRASVMLNGARVGEIVASDGLILIPQASPRTGVVRVGVQATRLSGNARINARAENGDVTTVHVAVLR